MSRPALLLAVFSTLIATLGLSGPAQALALTTSIKPLQLLVASISDGVSEPQLLIPGSSSPHDYQLRPSERRQLEQADLIFWIGPELEISLSKVLKQLPSSTRVIALAADPEDLEPRIGAETHHHHSDPHIWLDPDQAAELAQQIARILSEADPSHQSDYQKNLTLFLERLAQLDQALQKRLEPVRQRGYFVFHDAYRGFEQHYQLNHLGAFTLSPERRPGARHLAAIRNKLQQQQAVCVFSEPQFNPALVSNLIEESAIRHAELDPLGVDLVVNADGYFRLLEKLAEAFVGCLSER